MGDWCKKCQGDGRIEVLKIKQNIVYDVLPEPATEIIKCNRCDGTGYESPTQQKEV